MISRGQARRQASRQEIRQSGSSNRDWFRGRRSAAFVVIVAGVFVCGGLWWFREAPVQVTDPPIIDPPIINVTSCSPSVADAIARARADIQRSPDSAKAWGHLAMFLVAHQFQSDAIPCFEQATRLDPEDFRWPYLLGVTLLVSDREAAVTQFRRAVQVGDDVGVAQNRLGELLLDLGQYDDAQIHLRHAQRLRPDEVRPYLGLARLAYVRGDMADALEWAKRAARISPEERAVHELLALIYQQSNRRELALREMAIVESLPNRPLRWNDPVAAKVVEFRQDADWSLGQAESMLAGQQVYEAIGLLEATLRRDRQNPRVVCALARALIQVQRLDDAADILEQAANTHPQIAEVHFQLGVVHFLQDKHTDAQQAFQEAIEIKPDYTLAHYNLGHTLVRLGDDAAALPAFRAAIQYRPTHQGAHTNAGRILLGQGKSTEALRHLRVAVQLAPNDELSRRLFRRATELSNANK